MNTKPHTQQTKDKIRLARLGQKLSESHKKKVIKTLRNGKAELNPNWKGGSSLKGGYVMLLLRDHPNAYPNGYYPEHRLVMENSLKRFLFEEEHIHHINGIKTDNRIENLQLLSRQSHGEEHWKSQQARDQRSELMKQARKNKFWSTKKLTKQNYVNEIRGNV